MNISELRKFVDPVPFGVACKADNAQPARKSLLKLATVFKLNRRGAFTVLFRYLPLVDGSRNGNPFFNLVTFLYSVLGTGIALNGFDHMRRIQVPFGHQAVGWEPTLETR